MKQNVFFICVAFSWNMQSLLGPQLVDFKHLSEMSNFEKITSVFTHFVWENFNFKLFGEGKGGKILKI